MPSFEKTGFDQPIHQVVFPLIAVSADQTATAVLGTAVLIGPGCAITAYHVIEEIHRKMSGPFDSEGSVLMNYQILGAIRIDKGTREIPFKVHKIWRAIPFDIAILDLAIPEDLPSEHDWIIPRIQLLPPTVGTRVFGIGFPNSSVTYPRNVTAQLELDPRTAAGTVIEVHHLERDKAMLPFPCFRTNARFDGGMSGGPIFTENGMLCGIVCSNLPPDAPDGEHVSYGSALWPMLATPISQDSGESPPLYEFFQKGQLAAVDLDKITVIKTASGNYSATAKES